MGGLGELLLKVNPWRQAAIAARAERDVALAKVERLTVQVAELQTELSRECANARTLREELNASRASRGLPPWNY